MVTDFVSFVNVSLLKQFNNPDWKSVIFTFNKVLCFNIAS